MRVLSLLFLCAVFLAPSLVFSEGNHDLSGNCEGCHKEISRQWKGSAHGMAHFTKDEFFGKVMKAVSQKTEKEIGGVQKGCLTCHAQQVDGPLSDDVAKEGVSCILCHSIGSVDRKGDTGGKGVTLLPEGTMAGPSPQSNASHGTVHSGLFTEDSDNLCLICHEELKNPQGVVLCTTGIEHASSRSGKKCVDCHMTEEGQKTHAFRGARNSDILKDAVELDAARKGDSLLVSMKNLSSHKFPTGNPARMVIVSIDFKKGNEVVETRKEILNAQFLDEQGKPTLAPFSVKAGQDTRLSPDEKREYSFSIPKGTTGASVKVLYRLMPEPLADKLQIKDEAFAKVYPVAAKNIPL